jgi:hypothetical protein
MKKEASKFKQVKITNKGYGALNGTKIYLTTKVYKKLKDTKTRQGQTLLQLLEIGRAVRGFKHLLEHITALDKSARIILTHQTTKKSGHDYFINIDEYTERGLSRFLTLYRSTALDIAQSYLASKFPSKFDNPDQALSNKEISKTGRHFDKVLDELSQEKKHKNLLIKKTSEIVRKLQEEKKLLKKDIDSLEELKKQSSIAFYKEKLDELAERFTKHYHETKGKNPWQSWIYTNNWIMGIQYLSPIEKERVGFDNIPDYLFPTLDGFLDILEIKLPSHDVIKPDDNHPGSYAWAPDTNLAIGQVTNYLFEMESHPYELKEKINKKYSKELGREISIVKPRGFILVGVEDDWIDTDREAFRKLNHTLHGIEVITYTDLIRRGQYIVDLYSKGSSG